MVDEVIQVEKDKTTIPITKTTRNRVKEYGKKGESWDSLLNRIMDEVEIPIITMRPDTPSAELIDVMSGISPPKPQERR